MTFLKCLGEFSTIVIALLIVLDPLALMPLVASLAGGGDGSRKLIWKVISGATILLLFFTVTGTWILKIFGVTINDLRIGGGLLLLIIALNLVTGGRMGSDKEAGYQAAIAPLICPLLVGPGAITAAVVLAAIHGVFITSLAALAAMLISLMLFLMARFMYRLMGDMGTDLVSRVMGVLIATIAISYIRAGVTGFVQVLRTPR